MNKEIGALFLKRNHKLKYMFLVVSGFCDVLNTILK